MNLLTNKQRLFIIERKIKEGGLYMFPRFGFTAYETPSFSSSEHIDTNPFTKSLDREQFEVKSITDGWCRGNFHHRPNNPDFYLRKDDLAARGMTETVLLLIFTWLPMVIYNLFTKADTSLPKRVSLSDKVKSTKEDYFTPEQFEKIIDYYNDSTLLINFWIAGDREKDRESYPPSEINKDEPLIWKLENWKWFFEKTNEYGTENS